MSMFSSRHYAAIAVALRKTAPTYDPASPKTQLYITGSDDKFTEVIGELTKLFRDDNPYFNVDQFHDLIVDWGGEPRGVEDG